ncbi:MAG: Uma2 family endonuclease [Coleofasciculaceae cyanobacterium]
MVISQENIIRPAATLTVTWEKLPDDYKLEEEPVENTGQPLIAGALREPLELIGYIKPEMLIASNLGICATVNGELVIKAPDWFYVPKVQPITQRCDSEALLLTADRKSYTPNLEGDTPSIVMEFLSDTEGGEYSVKRSYPPGKWFFYEQVLKIPTYVIFEPESGLLEVYRLQEQRYELELPDPEGRHWLGEMGLFLGVWRGEKEGRTGYWLRWWDEGGNLLLWGVERLEQEHQRAEQERQRAEQERQRADKLAAYLRSQGINPDEIE